MREVNVLVSSGGRRIGLIECIREALIDNNVKGQVFATDSSLTAPAIHLADKAWQVPRCSDPRFSSTLLATAIKENVKLIVPTIDSELLFYAEHRDILKHNGIHVSISAPATVKICRNKVLTHQWLVENAFPTVRQSTPIDVQKKKHEWKLPLIVKPDDGSASKGVRIIRSFEELQVVSEMEDGLIVQELATGTEHTINVYVDEHGKCACAVPHQRLEVRSGEVSKAVTVKNRQMMQLASAIAERLPGARGMLNIQCFRSSSDELKVIEINARVGGGYPVAHHAGARFTHWLIEELLGIPSTAIFDEWQDDLAMLRYDCAVFRPGSVIRETHPVNGQLNTHAVGQQTSQSEAPFSPAMKSK